jgi:hypothetical protein
MNQEESIYNIIPKLKISHFYHRLYHSKHSPLIPPTSSTFNLHGTSFPEVSNINGDNSLPIGGHPLKGESMTFGLPIGSYKPNPKKYHKKGDLLNFKKPKIVFRSKSEIKKPPIPKKNEFGLILPKTNKNYVSLNIIDNFLFKRKICKNQSMDFLKRKGYGKIPKYIFDIRKTIEDEKKHLLELKKREEEENEKLHYKLKDNELNDIREGLKKQMNNLRKQYGFISHKRVFDTLRSLKKKEDLEKKINIIENDIKIMSHSNIIVDSTLN